ncbi:c-type cytochrome [Methylobacillus flagellatus]|uniref:c-type cytochrome n=1 Tax=Methylobacillus flagellatus TaxID=405 RepID=UPI0038621445
MKKFLCAGFMAHALLCGGSANAADEGAAQALAKKSGCLACHNVDKKVLGPSYKEVSAKYKNDKGAEAKLVAKVKAGGSGSWGDMPMPPNAHVKDEDIKAIVQWVLTL